MSKCAIDFSLLSEKILASRSFAIFFLISTVIQCSYSCSHRSENASKTSDGCDFDMLIFTQSWPATNCFKSKAQLSSHKCILPEHETWVIHRMWPSRNKKFGPSFCNKTQSFSESALSPIVHELEEKWPNIHYGKTAFSFWRYEWEKHGTCATVLDDVNTQLKYFRKALRLMDEFNMTRVLTKAKILPGQNYALEEITEGIKRVLSKTVLISCVKNPRTLELYLYEIKICLDKSFRQINCREVLNSNWTACDREMPVNYLSTTRFKGNNKTNSISEIENNTLFLLWILIFFILLVQSKLSISKYNASILFI